MSIVEKHFQESSRLLLSLKDFKKEINEIVESITKCDKNNKKILVAGNGGSCSDSEHFAGELLCTFNKINRKSFSAIPLTSHSAALTAWSNDFEFDSFFKRQVNAHGKEDDILFLLSTGGGNLTGSKSSANLVYAAEEGIKKKMKIISLVGKDGGELKKISNICIHVKSKNTAYIQEAHMSILHCICEILDNLKT
jgi:D-sedoheptulose 7-phosphate isomerase